MVEIQGEQLVRMYTRMLTIRLFEERMVELYARNKLYGFPHLYVGQEAVAVGVCSHLSPQDLATSTHRGHGHCIAKGMDLKLIIAELAGRRSGYCRGKGGTMHLASQAHGIVCGGIVGGGVPTAVGAAMTAKLKQTGAISVAFYGDGAANQGVVHESLNLAAIYSLPVIFVCENNQFAVSVPQRYASAVPDIATHAVAYNIPGQVVDGMDVVAVYTAMGEAVARARNGGGPTLLECKTYRFRGHHEGDPNTGTGIYRSREDVETWMKRDPIQNLLAQMLTDGILDSSRVKQIEAEIQVGIEDAIRFAMDAPFPDLEEAYEDVFAEEPLELRVS